jgi:hypothetical protein
MIEVVKNAKEGSVGEPLNLASPVHQPIEPSRQPMTHLTGSETVEAVKKSELGARPGVFCLSSSRCLAA